MSIEHRQNYNTAFPPKHPKQEHRSRLARRQSRLFHHSPFPFRSIRRLWKIFQPRIFLHFSQAKNELKELSAIEKRRTKKLKLRGRERRNETFSSENWKAV